ncbi:hypothetical protein PAI11_20380 [Patulibacter medicamentivorans]|uniref:Asl1-like glycosyl hydrolase catalytic domain-containing protein n=2 Tax=Patulibacter medicamentivorans TaxID=1097667 RepID=H0E5E7_9ACTN|nr:hypothetical protein PAI11_20380 [Patulibacter medicamentivorans]
MIRPNRVEPPREMDFITALLLFLLSLLGLQPQQPPKPTPEPPALGFSLGLDPDQTGTGIPNGIAALKAVKATIHRDGFNWAWLGSGSTAEHPVPDALDAPLGGSGIAGIDQLDRKYQALTGAGIRPLLVIGYAPAWASTRPRCAEPAYAAANPATCNQKYHPAPEFLPQYREVVAALARRYPKTTFEGWNEPDHEALTNPLNATTPERLAEEQCTLYEAVKSVDPDRTVLSPSMSDYYAPGYIGRYLTAVGSRRCHDVFSVHVYTGAGAAAVDVGVDSTLKRIRDARAGRDGTPLWVTEIGYSTADGVHDDASQAADLDRALGRLQAQADVRATIVHTLRDEPASWLTEGKEAGYGLLRTDWSPKPAFCSLVAAAAGSYSGC